MSSLATLPQCQYVANAIIADPSFTSVMQFLQDPRSANTTGYQNVKDFITNVKNPKAVSAGATGNAQKFFFDGTSAWGQASDLSNNGLKIQLILDDGTVILDTGKLDASNNAPDYGKKAINENHHSRPEYLQAMLSSSGVGSALRYSSTNAYSYQYYAVRLGNSPQNNIGALRIAYSTNTPSNPPY